MDYKDKIRKLLALAKSPEPEEAKLALLKARKLMAEHKQTVEMELETLIRKEERRFPEMQDSGSAKIIPVEVKFRETRSRIGIFEYLHQPRQRYQLRAVHEVCQERV